MKNPFKISDIVHHVFYGQGKVIDPNAPNHKKENGRTVLVQFEGCIRQYAPSELSFSKWQAPNHTRPLEKGLYIVKFTGEDVALVRAWNGSNWCKVMSDMTVSHRTRSPNNLYTVLKKVG